MSWEWTIFCLPSTCTRMVWKARFDVAFFVFVAPLHAGPQSCGANYFSHSGSTREEFHASVWGKLIVSESSLDANEEAGVFRFFWKSRISHALAKRMGNSCLPIYSNWVHFVADWIILAHFGRDYGARFSNTEENKFSRNGFLTNYEHDTI